MSAVDWYVRLTVSELKTLMDDYYSGRPEERAKAEGVLRALEVRATQQGFGEEIGDRATTNQTQAEPLGEAPKSSDEGSGSGNAPDQSGSLDLSPRDGFGPSSVAVPERVEAVARAIAGDSWAFDTGVESEATDADWDSIGPDGREYYESLARAALSVMGSGKVEVDREALELVVATAEKFTGDGYSAFENSVWALRAVLEQEGGEGE